MYGFMYGGRHSVRVLSAVSVPHRNGGVAEGEYVGTGVELVAELVEQVLGPLIDPDDLLWRHHVDVLRHRTILVMRRKHLQDAIHALQLNTTRVSNR